ncbi:MAG: glycosyltransferase [Myxococcota bacterium]
MHAATTDPTQVAQAACSASTRLISGGACAGGTETAGALCGVCRAPTLWYTAARVPRGAMSTELTIAICTADRPELCADLLDALRAAPAAAWSREVVVVDNGRERSADAVVAVRAACPELPVRRVAGPPRNIASARNVALAEARGELVLWLDDDQLVGPGFFADLERAWRARPAWSAGLRLAVTPVIDGPADRAMRAFFTPRLGQEGARVRRAMFSTNGFLVRRAALAGCAGPTPDGPFDPWFGTRGAEDTDVFLRAEAAGLRFSCTRLATASERILPERARATYMLRRAFRIGFTDTVIDMRRLSRARVVVDVIAHLGADCVALPCALASHDQRVARGLSLSRAAGKLWALAGRDYQHYR